MGRLIGWEPTCVPEARGLEVGDGVGDRKGCEGGGGVGWGWGLDYAYKVLTGLLRKNEKDIEFESHFHA